MNIRLYIAVTGPMEQSKSNLVYELSSSLNLYFQNRDCGEDVKNIEIGLLMTFSKEGYEEWYKPKKNKYIRYKEKKNLAGETMIIENTLICEIKLSDEQLNKFTGGDDELSKKVLVTEIINFLLTFDKLPKEVKDFELEIFKHDLKSFFDTMI